MADMASALEEMGAATLRHTLVQRVKAAEQVAASKSAADAAVEPGSFTATFASGLTLEQSSTGMVRESAAKELLRFRSAQKAQGVDAIVLPEANSLQKGGITSPLLQQIADSGISAEQQQQASGSSSSKGGSRRGNLRLKTTRNKGEGYSERMQERLASKSHRKDRIAKMKRVY